MKKTYLYGILTFLIVVSVGFVYAQETNSDNPEYNNYLNYKGVFYKTLDNAEPENAPVIKRTLNAVSLNTNSINLMNPEEGYYYITDEMLLWITTTNPSSCNYTFNGQTKNMIDNETDHYEYLYGLADNMASDDPYIVDFSCNDGSSTAFALTYFWINLSELDKYFIRENIGDWKYLNSRDYFEENNYSIASFEAYYKKNNIFDSVVVNLFENKESMNFSFESDNISLITLGNRNYYSYFENDINLTAWTSGNLLIINLVFPEENTTLVDLGMPNDIMNDYLEKYPNDLKYGVCGDGKVDIFNLDGKKEDCDKNKETVSCGINIGECKLGQKTKMCKEDCTWGTWGACNATQPKNETCDSKDNDCDGQSDEGGVCNQTSTINSSLTLIKPLEGIYKERNILFNLSASAKLAKLFYSDNGQRESLLCMNCNSYARSRTLNEGNHTLIFRGLTVDGKNVTNQTIIFIDSKKPQISNIKPQSRRFTNGSDFYIKYTEDNCKFLNLKVGYNISWTELKVSCESGRNIERQVSNDISQFNGKEVEYSFKITDIANNSLETRPTRIKVDTMSPQIKDLMSAVSGRYASLNMTILNEDKNSFNKVEFMDSSGKWKMLCSSLRNNVCYKKVYFPKGIYSIIVKASDKAGNTDIENVSIKILN